MLIDSAGLFTPTLNLLNLNSIVGRGLAVVSNFLILCNDFGRQRRYEFICVPGYNCLFLISYKFNVMYVSYVSYFSIVIDWIYIYIYIYF